MCATKLLIEDNNFQREKIPQVVTSIATQFSRVLAPAADSRLGLNNSDVFREICEQAIRFKLDLIVSPEEYCLFFFKPGDEYNPEWMIAEDEEGRILEREGCISNIRLCLFPGISQYQNNTPQVEPDDISTAFSYKKPFTFQWMNEAAHSMNHVIAKAVVLMEHSNDAMDTRG